VNYWPPISRDDLKTASGLAGFDTVFPLLIRRLIAETSDGLTSIDMPGGSGTAAGGFDGIATTIRQTTFVPAGTSVWELSVGGGQSKANDDYGKRLAAPDGGPTSSVTYVQALLAPWTKARAWTTARNKEGRWREVRGYNLDLIHAWLDVAPATTAWLAEQLGKKMPGVRSLDQWWTDTWLPSTRVPLDSAVVLAGRQDAASELVKRLNSGQKWVTLGGDLRTDEARAFVAAALASGDTQHTAQTAARTLIATNAGSLEQLVAQPQPLVLLISEPALARELPIHHPHQFIVTAASPTESDIQIPRVDSQLVEIRLKSYGVTTPEPWRLATLARRSLLALRRALAHEPGPLTPAWADEPDVIRRRLLTLGSWHAESIEDCRIVSECVGRTYEQTSEAAIELSAGDDMPFLGQVDDVWHVVAVEDAWTLLGGSLTGDDLDAARRAAVEVLSEVDPVLSMAPGDRWAAGMHGITRRFSTHLRTGVAQTLAIAASNTAIRGHRGSSGAQWARGVVRELLAGANADATYQTWASLASLATLLAEAAPDAFLTAIRDGLTGTTPLHASMFQDSDIDRGFFGPTSPHTSIIRAIEVLAWSPEHVDDAADLLARLATIDPGGKQTNRPAASLLHILSAGNPNTTADTDHRIRIIETIARTYPGTGRQLLLDLIPDAHGDFYAVHPSPRFGEAHYPTRPSPQDQLRVITLAASHLIAGLPTHPDSYPDLIEKIGVLPQDQHQVLVDQLRELGETMDDEEQRARLFEALRKKVALHEEYADATWALPREELEALKSVRDALAPRGAQRRHAWMFADPWIELGDIAAVDDIYAYAEEVLLRRAQAIGEILEDGGLNAVADFATTTRYPDIVGQALAADPDGPNKFDTDMLAWLRADATPGGAVAAGYFAERLRGDSGELRDHLLDAADEPLMRARILRFTGHPSTAWELLKTEDHEVVEHYWREFQFLGLGSEFTDATPALHAASALLDVDRPAAALNVIVIYLRGDDSLEAAEIAAASLERLLQTGLDDLHAARLDSYGFERLFELLARHRDELGRQRVVSLEWQLFPALRFDANAPTLHRAIVEDAPFFVELVTACFRPQTRVDDDPDDPDELERRRAIAGRAWDVLRSLRLCPGVSPDGDVDPAAMRAWVLDARTLLNGADRLASGDSQIGEILASAPPSNDGSIHEAVRDLLEDVRSDDLDRGLRRGIYNQRGIQTKGIFDGGAKELELAQTLREQAEAAAAWPRTRRLLKVLAESYEAEALAEDAEAERRRQGLG